MKNIELRIVLIILMWQSENKAEKAVVIKMKMDTKQENILVF